MHGKTSTIARKARKHSTIGIYHVMLRGINRQDLFHEEADYLFFLERLRLLTHPKNKKYEPISPLCDIYAYCLMTNHIHIMLAPRDVELSEVIKPLAISYARYYNTKHFRCGYLFQDRFKSEPVDDFNYAVTLFRYIHQNPVQAGIVETVEDYPWSSWREYVSDKGLVNAIIERSFMLEQIGMDDLCRLVRESVDADSSSLERAAPSIDLGVTEMLLEECHGIPIVSISSLPKKERDRILISVLQKGAGIRQQSKPSAVGFSIIRRLKNVSNSPSP